MDPTSPRVGPRDAFYWRRPLIPQADRCGVVTVAFPPTTVSSDDVILQMMSFSSGVLTFLVSWDTPLFLNGDLVHYELCIGENEITEDDICSSPSQCFYIEPEDTSDEFPVIGCISLGNLISVDNPATNVSYHVVIGTEFLIMQVQNTFHTQVFFSSVHAVVCILCFVTVCKYDVVDVVVVVSDSSHQ